MSARHKLLHRLRALFRKDTLDADMAEEMRLHLEQRTERNLAAGMPPDDARFAAQRSFGGVEQIKERAREDRGWMWLEQVVRDLQHAARSLRRSPGLVLTAVLSLGLGIGVNTALFAAINALLFSSPTVTQVDRLVGIEPGNSNQFSHPNYLDLRASGIFDDVVGYRPVRLTLRSDERSEKVAGLAVTENFFAALGIRTQIGRVFSAGEAAPERAPRLAVLSHAFAQRQVGSGPDLVGKSLLLNGESFLVLGILPEDFRPVTPLSTPDVFVPLSDRLFPNLSGRKNGSTLVVLGRLRDGVTPEQARAATTVLGQRLERAYPDDNEAMGRPARIYPLRGSQLHGAPQEFYIFPLVLLVLFGLLLLIACANVAGLLLARASNRRREIAVRIALGASRRRLIQSMLAESLLLSFLGAVAGTLLATWLVSALGAVALPGGTPLRLTIKPDLALYAFGVGMAFVTGLLCGIVPAIRSTRANVVAEIQQGGSHGATARLWLRHVFVVGQVAASVVLLFISALFVRSLMQIAAVNPGFDLDHAVVAKLDVDRNRYPGESYLQFAQQAVERLEKIPGVRSAALANLIPLGGDAHGGGFEREGSDASRLRTHMNSVGPRYFETMGIPLRQGREFQAGDRSGQPSVAIVNQTFADRMFPGLNPVGQRVSEQRVGPGKGAELEIVGVVSNSKYAFLSEEPKPVLYYSYAQRPGRVTVHLQIAGLPETAILAVRRALTELDPTMISEVQILRDATSLEFTLRRLGSALLGSLGLLGLLLALIGLYGVMAFVVASRTMEIGVRMALGATAQRVVRDILQQGLRIVALGLAIGLALSLLLTRPLASVLAGLSPVDPLALGGTILALAFTGLAASYLPARRAAKVDPLVALRCE